MVKRQKNEEIKEQWGWVYRPVRNSELKNHVIYRIVSLTHDKSAKKGGWRLIDHIHNDHRLEQPHFLTKHVSKYKVHLTSRV